jgi:O-antigen ligase
MLQDAVRSKVNKVISLCALITCVIVTPNQALDPINLPKMVVLVIGAFIALGLIASSLSTVSDSNYKRLGILLVVFLLSLISSVLFSETPLTQGIYGVHGRNTGLLTYASFAILMFSSVLVSNSEQISKFHKYLVWAGVISTVYGLFQFLGVDPAGWDIYASPVVGFLGNSDFQSAFLAIFASAILALSVFRDTNRYLNFALSVFAMLVAVLTQAKQGIIAFILGASIIILVIAIRDRIKVLLRLYVLGMVSGVILLVLGILDQGPLGHFIYKTSLEARFYYWQSALRMFLDNLLTGVGLDSFGDYYPRYRTEEAVSWNTQPTNAAHNVFLDYAANGGIIFLALNITVVVLVLKSFREVVINRRNFNPYYISIFAGWVAFQAQSLISINQIGLAVWNWVFSGFLIGFYFNERISLNQKVSISPKNIRKKLAKVQNTTPTKAIIGGLIGALLSSAIVIPAYVGSVSYWKMINSGDLSKVEKSAYVWPKDEFKYWSVLLTVGGNASALDAKISDPNPPEIQKQIDDLYKAALEINKDATKDFPNSVHLWRLYAKNPMATKEEALVATNMVKMLDPNNPVL